MRTRSPRRQSGPRVARKTAAALDELIAEATVDCYDEPEAVTGFHAAIEEHLQTPFTTRVLGMEVRVEGVNLTDADEIVAICRRDQFRQAIPLLELPLPKPPPRGVEWIEAYRRWARGG